MADYVADDEVLYRRIPLRRELFKLVDGRVRPSSQAFSDRLWRPSVDRAKLIDHDPTRTQQQSSDSVMSLITGEVRKIDTVVQKNAKGETIQLHAIDVEPVPLNDNPAHAEIFAIPQIASERVFRRLIERLAIMSRWELGPPEQLP